MVTAFCYLLLQSHYYVLLHVSTVTRYYIIIKHYYLSITSITTFLIYKLLIMTYLLLHH